MRESRYVHNALLAPSRVPLTVSLRGLISYKDSWKNCGLTGEPRPLVASQKQIRDVHATTGTLNKMP